jgi:hypothetical protein
MILNIIPDSKFTPFLQGIFAEAAPGKHIFRVVDKNKEHPVYSRQTEYTSIVGNSYLFSKTLLDDANRASCIIFHSVNVKYSLAASRLPLDLPIIWRGWGFDYYPLLVRSEVDLILPDTRRLLQKNTLSYAIKYRPAGRVAAQRIIEASVGKLLFPRFVARANYFSCCVPDDFALLKNNVSYFPDSFLPLNYYSSEDIFLAGAVGKMAGPNILVGNSATPTNNHVEIFKTLAGLDLRNRKIYVPLSYGDPLYQKKIMRLGYELFGNAFIPLNDFMDINRYNELLSSVGYVVMGHLRQQGIGNISSALLRGAKVFMFSNNSITSYYKKLGAKIYPLETELNNESIAYLLSENEADENRMVMKRIWDRVLALAQVNSLLSIGRVR